MQRRKLNASKAFIALLEYEETQDSTIQISALEHSEASLHSVWEALDNNGHIFEAHE